MKQRLLKTICLLLLPVLLLTGCWQEEPLPGDGDLLQANQQETEPADSRLILPELFSLPYAPELTLDPITCPDGMQQVVASLICEGLFRLGTDLEPEPCLCQSYTYDDASYTYVFTLRSGVTFSDGTPLTSADVKTALDRARKSERYGSRLSGISQITAGDDTVTVVLSAPNTGFSALLDVPIPKAGTEAAPIGTGPYLLSAESTGTYLVSNQSWWRSGQPTDRIALVEASDQDTMLYRFTSHDVQLVTTDLTGTDPISATGSVSYCDANTTILQYLGCNTAREPLDAPAFRRALSLGIPRQTLVSAFLSGHGTAAQFPISPVSPLYPSELAETYSYDAFAAASTSSSVASGLPKAIFSRTVPEESQVSCRTIPYLERRSLLFISRMSAPSTFMLPSQTS